MSVRASVSPSSSTRGSLPSTLRSIEGSLPCEEEPEGGNADVIPWVKSEAQQPRTPTSQRGPHASTPATCLPPHPRYSGSPICNPTPTSASVPLFDKSHMLSGPLGFSPPTPPQHESISCSPCNRPGALPCHVAPSPVSPQSPQAPPRALHVTQAPPPAIPVCHQACSGGGPPPNLDLSLRSAPDSSGSAHLAGTEEPPAPHCKQNWHASAPAASRLPASWSPNAAAVKLLQLPSPARALHPTAMGVPTNQCSANNWETHPLPATSTHGHSNGTEILLTPAPQNHKPTPQLFPESTVKTAPSMCTSGVDPELWEACAGPLVQVPDVGALVVYFPQGHVEQEVMSIEEARTQCAGVPHPPYLFCRVLAVSREANYLEEVRLRLKLAPLNSWDLAEVRKAWEGTKGLSPISDALQKTGDDGATWKTLTKSDVTGQGGLSVPKKAAEVAFPYLDLNVEMPAQSVPATDMFGRVWDFRHVFRGKPRRHLLTSNWSVFAADKNLRVDDRVVILKGPRGTIKVGVRRMPAPKSVATAEECRALLEQAASASQNGTHLDVVQHIRTPHFSPFIVPLDQFCHSLKQCQSAKAGASFKMMFETSEFLVRRFRGNFLSDPSVYVAEGPSIPELEPLWRTIQVVWDDSDPTVVKPKEVSPWEITLCSPQDDVIDSPKSAFNKSMKRKIQIKESSDQTPGSSSSEASSSRTKQRIASDSSLLSSTEKVSPHGAPEGFGKIMPKQSASFHGFTPSAPPKGAGKGGQDVAAPRKGAVRSMPREGFTGFRILCETEAAASIQQTELQLRRSSSSA